VIYPVLSIRLFRSTREEATPLESLLVQIARYTLLLVFISGLVLNITLGKFVSQSHHILSIFAAIMVVGPKYLPYITRKPNTLKTYAWVFLILFILMIALGITAQFSTLPQF
jgi:hypothetical protein